MHAVATTTTLSPVQFNTLFCNSVETRHASTKTWVRVRVRVVVVVFILGRVSLINLSLLRQRTKISASFLTRGGPYMRVYPP